MTHAIYSTSNEDAILKSIGPYKIISADESFQGNIIPETIEVSSPVIIGETKLYGEEIIAESTE